MPKPISGSSPALCSVGDLYGNPQDKFNDCNFDQGADPIVLPDGTIVVVFNNGNTPAGNPNSQQLAVISHDAGNNWSGPVKVGDDVSVGEPMCADAGTTCIPGADVRTNDFPRIGENRQNGHLYVVWQDYRTGEYDIHLSRSTDGGLTWQESNARVNPDSGRDHYFPAVDVANGDQGDEGSRGDLVAVSYFRTDRVPNENGGALFAVGDPGVGKGNTDYSLAGGHGAATPYAARQVSPETPPPSFRGFNGDYSGLAVTGREAHPLWSDARNNAPPQFGGPQQDEDIFTDIVVIPGE